MATTTVAGSIIVVAALLAVAVAMAQAPSPAPVVGMTGPSVAAPGPAPLDCVVVLANLSDCLTYVQAGSTLAAPDKPCCPEVAGLVDSQPVCLCQLLANKIETGINIDIQKALKLPAICAVTTPPVSLCSALGYPVGVLMPSPAPSPSPGGMSPGGSASGNKANGASGIAVSQISSLLVGFVAAFLTTLI